MAKEHNGAGIWFDPQNFVPVNQEIVAMDCEVMSADGGSVRLIQTGMYEVTEDGKERWHVPQAFSVLLYWMRYPQLLNKENSIKQLQPMKVIL
jgi:hypothetical protein